MKAYIAILLLICSCNSLYFGITGKPFCFDIE